MNPTKIIKPPHQMFGYNSPKTELGSAGEISKYNPVNNNIAPIVKRINPTKYQIGFISSPFYQ
jgi:hypothetical protein